MGQKSNKEKEASMIAEMDRLKERERKDFPKGPMQGNRGICTGYFPC